MGRRHTVEVDHGRPLAAQPQVGHNRWHPGIEPILSIDPGDSVVLQTLDAMDGQLTAASTAAEMAATVHLSFALHKGEAARRRMRGVCYTRDREARAERAPADGYIATTGICVDETGRNESEDANLAARNALLAMIDYLADDRGYTRQQAYAICSVAVNLRLSQLVDVPNFVASATLPLSIFTG